jgi:(p)ppGpp synthase/HD superfamily hydrolase
MTRRSREVAWTDVTQADDGTITGVNLTLISTCEDLAREAHGADLNPRNGELYFLHPTRVAAHAVRLTEGLDPRDRTIVICAAWLHDVVEDTDVDVATLRAAGVPEDVLEVVVLMTKRKGVSNVVYLAAIAAHRLARLCKLADLADNTDPHRMAQLTPLDRKTLAIKYTGYFTALAAPVPDHVALAAAA